MENEKNTTALLYPLRFAPILKQRVWGGEKFSYNNGEVQGPIGESWEISGLEGNISVVTNGELAGRNLNDLIEEHQHALVGQHVYKEFENTFPLLFKFIDAEKDLSVQLHPDDILAKKRHNSFGKTEMWYIIEAEENANLILGFNQHIDKKTYQTHLNSKQIKEILNFVPVSKGDAYLIHAGLVHAICKGIFLAEVQQTSDITYRIYDWDRLGVSGKPRTLHTALAYEAIDFEQRNSRLTYSEKQNEVVNLCAIRYFTTNKLFVTEQVCRDLNSIDSFVVYMCVEGSGKVILDDKTEQIKQGETVLIPACAKDVKLEGEKFGVLEVYIPKQV